MHRRYSNLALVGASALLSLCLVEAGLRLIAGESHYYVNRPGLHMVLNPDPRYVAGVQGPSHFVVNAWAIIAANSNVPGTLHWLQNREYMSLSVLAACLTGIVLVGRLLSK